MSFFTIIAGCLVSLGSSYMYCATTAPKNTLINRTALIYGFNGQCDILLNVGIRHKNLIRTRFICNLPRRIMVLEIIAEIICQRSLMCHQKQGRIKWIEYTGQSIFFGPLLRTHFDIWQTHKMAELVFFKEIFRHQAKKTEKKKKSILWP